ncbi:MlaD family protein [Roseiconus lacunae]|uniref:MlaD family protein n=1 Tax=Roseiconus lacunae TaxID=2605694 RepID=A0ABT7PRP6_9BACT|nr:MlaD family protein [Roseiconus lacunae]MCD0460346.1 MlaD family protein [Roseiconus lacunae]MDM4018949.1 MlaD family protein [Roseiconus lacunae]WRQ51828.1 MlaD family protein [Stieleria sp. HD01]
MDDNRLKFGVGVLVIAALGIGVILTFLFGAVPRVLTREFELLVTFPNADGISSNTKVLLRGVEIGRVLDKNLRDKDVLVRIAIESAYQDKLTHEYLPRIVTGSMITRDAKLEFYKADEAELVAAWDEELPVVRNQRYTNEQFISRGIRKSDPFDLLINLEDELRLTLESVRDASGSLQLVGENVNQLVGDAQGVVGTANDELGDLSQEARNALIEFQGAMREVRGVLANDDLKAAMAELPSVLTEAQATFRSTQETFDSFRGVGNQFERVGVEAEKVVKNVDQTVDAVRDTVQSAKRSFGSAEQAIKNIETITEPIAANSDEIVAQALSSLRNLDATLRQIETFGTAINNSNGTVRRLLEDDEVYWNLKRTLENVEMATAKLRPIMDDVRIFSDKIARDPRELGVRGALNKRPSGFGLK